MPIFTDVITGDELFSDAFPVKEHRSIAYEVDCEMMDQEGIDVDADLNGEGDSSPEEDTKVRVNNVVQAFRLQPTVFDKKVRNCLMISRSYFSCLKSYLTLLKAHVESTSPERVPTFEKDFKELVKTISAYFKDFEFFVRESDDPDGMVALLSSTHDPYNDYRANGVTPFFTFWRDDLAQVNN
ncbi:hypothetical protein L198_04934 [Cryptococcus wingfieldii CBS 7118]|uniref:Translationally-controlled tumor protein homolog n=1 Tax=Cryptococcus wingfieldii CBS 7118 TaxID=1295528 RepID=A0A1E3J1N2_9TREE|nr:hypothetical protein L198_04934 [Cryptococcus wingfieldii CBS 7118]ODN94790.1 hypothetical protein L198_04934 [Cryptococcus wingfieldii CBS 7118]